MGDLAITPAMLFKPMLKTFNEITKLCGNR
jgi:hypothetical protein